MITIQHNETEKNGIFEAWLQATEEGACTEPVQVGEMTYGSANCSKKAHPSHN